MSRSTQTCLLFTVLTLLACLPQARAQQYWNGANTTGTAGAITGATGTWFQDGTTNWTTATGSGAFAWGDGAGNGTSTAIFTVANNITGTYTVTIGDGFGLTAPGMQFNTGGYTLIPGGSSNSGVALTGTLAVINTVEGATTITAAIGGVTGTTVISKTGAGMLILSGANNVVGGGVSSPAGVVGITKLTLNGGALVGTTADSFGGSSSTLTLNGGTGLQNYLVLNGPGSTGVNNFGNNVVVNGTVLILNDRGTAGTGVTENFGNLALNGNLWSQANGSTTSLGTNLTFGAVTLSGASDGVYSSGLTSAGISTVTLASVNGSSSNFVVGGTQAQIASVTGSIPAITVTGTTNLGTGNLTKFGPLTFTLGTTGTFNTGALTTSGSFIIVQDTQGTVILNGSETSLTVYVQGGSLQLGTPNSTGTGNFISDSATFTLAGANLIAEGQATVQTETISALNLGVGSSRITAGSGTAAQSILFNALGTRATGSSINFAVVGGNTGNVQFATSQSGALNASGMLGGWATSGGTDNFATLSTNGLNIVSLGAVGSIGGTTSFTNTDFSSTATAATNVVETLTTLTAPTVMGTNTTVGSLKLVTTATGSVVLDLGGNTLNDASGGIIAVGTSPAASYTIVNGTITAGATSTGTTELFFTEPTTATKVNIAARIADNGFGGPLNLVFAGNTASNFYLTNANTYTGSTYITTAGTVWILTDRGLGAEPTTPTANNIVFANGGTLGVLSYAPFTLSANRGITLTAGGGQISYGQTDTVVTQYNTITGTGPMTYITTDNSPFVIAAGASTYDGVTNVSSSNSQLHFFYTSIGNIGDSTPTALGTPSNAANGVINLLFNGGNFTYDGITSATTDREIHINSGSSAIFGTNGAGKITFNGNYINVGPGASSSFQGYGLAVYNGNILQATAAATKVTVAGGDWQLLGENTYVGTTNLSGGGFSTLEYNTVGNIGSGPSSLGNPTAATGTIAISSGTFRFIGNTAQSTDRNIATGNGGGRIEASGSAPITFLGGISASASQTLYLGGNGVGFISGAGTLTGTSSGPGTLNMQGLWGQGTWTINNSFANTNWSTLGFLDGTLVLDYSNIAGATGLISAKTGTNTALTAGGGTLVINGTSASGINTQQSFTTLTTNGDTASTLSVVANGGNSTVVNFSGGLIINTAGMIDFKYTGNASTVFAGNATLSGSIADYATVNGKDFATFSTVTGAGGTTGTGTVVAFTNYAPLPTSGSGATNGVYGAIANANSSLGSTVNALGLKIAPTTSGFGLNLNGFSLGANSGNVDLSIILDGTNGSYTISNSSAVGALGNGGGSSTLYITTTGSGSLTISANLLNTTNIATSKVVKAGTGTLILSGTNVYAAQTDVTRGNLLAGSTTGLSASSIFNVNGSGVLNTNGFNSGVLFLAGNGIVQNASNTSATLTIGANNNNGLVGFNNAANVVGTQFTGLIQDGTGTGTLSIVKAGYGNEAFIEPYNALNTYSGSTSILSGILGVTKLDDTGAASSIGKGSVINIGSAGQLATLQTTGSLTANNETNRTVNLAAGGTSALDVVGVSSIVNYFTANNDMYGALLTLNGTVAGSGTLLKLGAGNLDLRGNNTYTGGTVVDQGILRFGTTQSIASTSYIKINYGGTVGPGYAMNQGFLNLITPDSVGVAALGADSFANLSFANLPGVALGALGRFTYNGTSLTPNATSGYQLGGGAYNDIYGGSGNSNAVAAAGPISALYIANANVITGNSTVMVSAHGSQGAAVVFDDTQDFTGTLTVMGNINAAFVSASSFPSNGSGYAAQVLGSTPLWQENSDLFLSGGTSGRLTGATNINLIAGGSLRIIATPGSSSGQGQILDNAVINLNGGAFAYFNDSALRGSAVASYTEKVGALNLNNGYSEIFMNSAVAGSTANLTFDSLNRQAGATILFAGGVNLGLSGTATITLTNDPGLSSTLATPWAFVGDNTHGLYQFDGATDFAIISTTNLNGAIKAANGTAITSTPSGANQTQTDAQILANPGKDWTLTGTTTSSIMTLGGNDQINTLRVTGAQTILVGTKNIAINGLLTGQNAANASSALTIGTLGDTGTITSNASGSGASELVINSGSAGSIVLNINVGNTTGGSAVTLVKTGLSDLTLNGTNNTYSGNIVIEGVGVLKIVNASGFGQGTGTIVMNSGALQFSGLALNTVVANNWIVNNDAVIQDAQITNAASLSGSMTVNGTNTTLFYASGSGVSATSNRGINGAIGGTGNIVIQGGGNTISFGGATSNTLSGKTEILGREDGALSTTLSLEKTGTATAISGNILLGVSSVTSGTTGVQSQEILILNKGLVGSYNNDVGVAGSQGQIADASVITFQGGNGYDAGIFRLNNQSETIGGIQSSTAGDGLIQNDFATAGVGSTLTLNTTGTNSYTFSGLIQNHDNSDTNLGILSLTKTGSGKQTLTNNNTYTGATTINQGVLAVTGTIAGSAFTVNSTGTLAGTGKVGAVTVASGGAINTADGLIGTLTVGNITLTGGALTFDIGAGLSNNLDLIASSGILNSTGGGNTIYIGNVTGTSTILAPGTYNLITSTTLTGTLSNFTLATTSLDGDTLSLQIVGNNLQLVVAGAAPATPPQYTLVATTTAGVTALHAGGTTTVTSTITNVGTGLADTLNYTNLGMTTSTGTLVDTPTSGTLTQGQAGTNTGTFTAGTTGTTVAITPTVGSVTGTSTGSGTLVSTNSGSIVVYTGQGVWNTTSSSTWGAISGTQTSWTAAGGTPGLDANFTNTDSAAFNTVGASQGVTVSLNGDRPSLNAISFNTVGGGYTIAQGTGTGSITLNNGASAATITDSGTGGANNTISAPIVLASNLNATVSTTDTVTLSGTISGAGKSVTKNGQGTLIMSGQNTYSAGTTVVTGTLVAGSSTTLSGSAIFSGPFGTGILALSNGATLNDNGTPIVLANSLTLNGTITLGGVGSLTFDGTSLGTPSTVTLLGNTTLVVNDTTTINDTVSSGTFSLTTAGTGNLNIVGATTGTGSTTIASGTVTISNSNGLSSGGINLAGGTLQYTGSTSGTLSQNITVATGIGTIFHSGTGLLTLSGTINKNGTTFQVSGGRNRITGQIVGSSPGSDVVYNGGSTTELDSASTYNGPTSISGSSTLLTGINNALPSPAPYTPLTLGALTDTGSMTNTLDLMGNSETVASISALGIGTNQVISSNATFGNVQVGAGASSTTGTLTVNVSGTTTNTYSGLLGDSNGTRAANNFSITKSGSGTLALTNANSYTGGTTIATGTLIVSNTTGSATGSGPVTLNTGATLVGAGSINSGTNNNLISGNVTAGNGGLSTSGSLTLTTSGTTTFSGANLTFNLDGSSLGQSNEVNLGSTGSVLFGSGTTLTFNLVGAASPIPGGTDYILFTAANAGQYGDLSLSGTNNIISNFNVVFTGSTGSQTNQQYYGNSYIFLAAGTGNIEIAVIPEPGTWALMLGGLALLVLYQRSRRKNNS